MPFTCLTLSPDGKTIACAGEATLRLWDAATRKPQRVMLNHQADLTALAYSPDGKYLASAGKAIRVWDMTAKKQRYSFDLPDDSALCLAASRDSKVMATATFGGIVWLWEMSSGQQLAKFKAHEENIGGLAITPDAKQLLTGSNDQTVKLWDLAKVLGGK